MDSAMTDPLERVREMRKQFEYSRANYEDIETCADYGLILADALEAILAIEVATLGFSRTDDYWNGYNTCLSEVHAIIAERLGK